MGNLGKTPYYKYVKKICFLMDRQRQLSISFCSGTFSEFLRGILQTRKSHFNVALMKNYVFEYTMRRSFRMGSGETKFISILHGFLQGNLLNNGTIVNQNVNIE